MSPIVRNRDRPRAALRCSLRFFPNAGIGFLHHHFAEIDADEIVLENAVIEHVLGRFAEIDDPFRQRRRFDAVRHFCA